MSTDFDRDAFSYSSPATWNSIPNSIKNCSSLYSFKCHLMSHLIAQFINPLPANLIKALHSTVLVKPSIFNF